MALYRIIHDLRFDVEIDEGKAKSPRPLSLGEKANIEAASDEEALKKASTVIHEIISDVCARPEIINEILTLNNIKGKTLVVVSVWHPLDATGITGKNEIADRTTPVVIYRSQDIAQPEQEKETKQEAQAETAQDDELTEVHEDFDYGDDDEPLPHDAGLDLLHETELYNDAGELLSGDEGTNLLGDYRDEDVGGQLAHSDGLDLLGDELFDEPSVGSGSRPLSPEDGANLLDDVTVGNAADNNSAQSSPAVLTKTDKARLELLVENGIKAGRSLEVSLKHDLPHFLSTVKSDHPNIPEVAADYYRTAWGKRKGDAPQEETKKPQEGIAPTKDVTLFLLEALYQDGVRKAKDFYRALSKLPLISEKGVALESRIAAFLAQKNAGTQTARPTPDGIDFFTSSPGQGGEASGAAPASSGVWDAKLPKPTLDAFGYAPMLPRTAMLDEPILGEPEATNEIYEPSRLRTQAFAEWALRTRRYASNEYLNALAKRLNIKVNSVHYADVREAMGISSYLTPELQTYADAYYRANDYLEESQSTRVISRLTTDAQGKTRSVGDIEARWWDKLIPYSGYNQKKKEVQEQLEKAREEEADAKNDYLRVRSVTNNPDRYGPAKDAYFAAMQRRKDLEYAENRLAQGYKAWDSPIKKDERAVQSAKDVIEEIRTSFDPVLGERIDNELPSHELAAVMRANDLDDETVAFGQDRNERARFAAEEAAQRNRQKAREEREMRKAEWGRRGETIGSVAGMILGGPAGAMVGGTVGKLIGSGAAEVANAFGILKSATDKLVETWQKFRAWIEESVNMAFGLAPYSGKIGVTKAWFQGKEYLRQVRRAQNLEDSSEKLVKEWDALLDETQALRDTFLEINLFIKTIIVQTLTWAWRTIKQFTGEKNDLMALALTAELTAGIAALTAGILTLNPALITFGAAATIGGGAAIMNNHSKDEEYEGKVKQWNLLERGHVMRGVRAEHEYEEAKKKAFERINDAINNSLTQKEIEDLSLESSGIRRQEDGTYKSATPTSHNAGSLSMRTIYDRILQIEGEVAREVYETNELDQKTVEKYQKVFGENWTKDLIMARVREKGARDYYEDAIAYNDMQRGSDYFQGYKHLQGQPTTARDVALIHNAINNAYLAIYKSNEYLLSIKESNDDIAEHTRPDQDKNNMLINGPLFDAMRSLANMQIVAGGRNGAQMSGSVYGDATGAPSAPSIGAAARNASVYGDMAGVSAGVGGRVSGSFRGADNIGRSGATAGR